MTDSEMKRFFDSLLRDEHDFNDTEIAIALLSAVALENDKGLCDSSLKEGTKNWVSER